MKAVLSKLLVHLWILSFSLVAAKNSLNLRHKSDETQAATGVDEEHRHLIRGGTGAATDQFPWYVQLRATFPNGTQTFCGGSLIGEDLVLTAASCLKDGVGNDAVTESGKAWVGGSTTSQGGLESDWDAYAINPAYIFPVPLNNVAIIKLATGFPGVQTIQLNDDADLPANETDVDIMGFGPTTVGGDDSVSLNTVTLDVLSSDSIRCQLATLDRPSLLCAAREIGTKAPCGSDEGGPLVGYEPITGRTFTVVQYGIFIYGDACAGALPSVYTRVSAQKVWIDTQSCLFSDLNCLNLCCFTRMRIAAIKMRKRIGSAVRNFFG